MDAKIYLVRHGKIECGNEKRYIGMTDLPLNREGMDQAGKLKDFFSDIELEKAYVSPLRRCVQTSEIILERRSIERIMVEELTEINMGEWEGKSFDYVRSRFPEQFDYRGSHIDTFIPPGGESFYQLQKRVMPAFEDIIRSNSGNILVIAHAGVNRVILSQLLKLPLSELMNIRQPYGCINVLIRDGTHQGWQCETVC